MLTSIRQHLQNFNVFEVPRPRGFLLETYEILDPILEDYVENDLGIDGLIEKGYDEAIVRHVVYAVELSEYKRRQAPPGVKITPKSFDRDRRMPIVNRYRN